MIIAIDGSAASGKGTLGKALAKYLGYDYLDTGALYRAVALSLIKSGENTEKIDENQIVKIASKIDLNLTESPLIRSEKVAKLASKIATYDQLRKHLLKTQRAFAANPKGGKGAILDGRDIGTVVLPDADLKFFIDAKVETRAKRRTKELLQSKQSAMFPDVLAELKERDDKDRFRTVAPLRAAEDAITIDTSELDAEMVFEKALKFVDPEKA